MFTTASSPPVVLTGRLDVATVSAVRDRLDAALGSGLGDLVVNLAGVEVMDATGLGMLVGLHRRAAKAGRRLVLRDVPPRLLRLLTATRLHKVLVVEPAAAPTPA